MAIIKAGTYLLNDVLTAPESESGYFEEWLYFASDGDAYDQIWVSYNEANAYVILTYIINPTQGSDEEVTGRTYAHNADGWLDDASKVISVPYDQEVGDEFGVWYAANTVAETAIIKAGTYRFHDVPNLIEGFEHNTIYSQAISFSIPLVSEELGKFEFYCDGIDHVYSSDSPNYELNITTKVVGASANFIEALISLGYSEEDYFPFNQSLYGGYAVEGAEWDFSIYGVTLTNAPIQTITIPADTEVSAEFSEWFSANAVEQKQISGVWKFKSFDDIEFPVDGLPEQFVNFSFTVPSLVDGIDYTFYCTCVAIPTRAIKEMSVLVASTIPDLSAYGWSFPNSFIISNLDGWRCDDYSIASAPDTWDFGTEPQYVSVDFYNWLTENATQPTASIYYNGSTIASLFAGQKATLACAGKKMASDVVVEVAENVGGECTGTHVIEVDELPTENIDEGAVYLCGGKYYKYAKELTDALYAGQSIATLIGVDASSFTYYYADTKPTENIAISSEAGLHVYYIEDENDLFVYGDFEGTGECVWMTFATVLGAPAPFLGVVSNASEATEEGFYALALNGFKAYIAPSGTELITENGTYDVADKANVSVSLPTVYICNTVDDLPADAVDGSVAYVMRGA